MNERHAVHDDVVHFSCDSSPFLSVGAPRLFEFYVSLCRRKLGPDSAALAYCDRGDQHGRRHY
jgi:hypothetical protein